MKVRRHRRGAERSVKVQFVSTADGKVLVFRQRRAAAPEFVEGLRELGASPRVIAAAQGVDTTDESQRIPVGRSDPADRVEAR